MAQCLLRHGPRAKHTYVSRVVLRAILAELIRACIAPHGSRFQASHN